MSLSISSAVPDHCSGANIRVLIIEDEALVAHSLADQLEDFGFEVLGIFASGEEALASISIKPAFAIVDLGLHGALDGIDTAIALRRQFGIPSLLTTGAGGRSVVERARPADPIAVLIKPYKMEDLRMALAAFTGARAPGLHG